MGEESRSASESGASAESDDLVSAAAPCSSYAATAFFAPVLLVCWLLSFVGQVLVAALTLPLLLCGVQRFHHIQSRIWRGANALSVCLALPIWRVRLLRDSPTPRLPAAGSIIFVNHRSNADPFFASWVLSRCCIEARAIYKSSLRKVPLGGCNSMLAGDLAVFYGDKEKIVSMIDSAKEVLAQGYNILVFPEGTRGPSGLLQDFKPTFFDICAELGCAGVPLCLLGTERAWPHGGFRLGCASVTACLGEPIMPGSGGGAELSKRMAAAFSRLAQKAVEEGSAPKDDPFITGRPYSWWRPPKELENLENEELWALLRSGKGHERGANLA